MNAPHAPCRALILVDVQQEYFDGPLEVRYPPREESLEHILAAIDTAEQHGIPIAAVQHGYPAGSRCSPKDRRDSGSILRWPIGWAKDGSA